MNIWLNAQLPPTLANWLTDTLIEHCPPKTDRLGCNSSLPLRVILLNRIIKEI